MYLFTVASLAGKCEVYGFMKAKVAQQTGSFIKRTITFLIQTVLLNAAFILLVFHFAKMYCLSTSFKYSIAHVVNIIETAEYFRSQFSISLLNLVYKK